MKMGFNHFLNVCDFSVERVKPFGTVLFVFDSLRPSQQLFSYAGTGLPGLNQY